MKLMMITGGLVGFSLGLGLGWVRDAAWPSILWRASVAAYLGGMLLRWWGKLWLKAWQAALQQRHATASVSDAKAAAPSEP
jgi:hypothetical protein